LTDYLDADGSIVLPEGVNLVTFLDRHIVNIGDAIAYRYLDYSQHADGKAISLTWAELGTRLRAIGARLQQVTSRGDRVAILAPQGIDYIVGFFAAIKAGNIAVPLFAPELPGHAERLNAVLGDAQPAVVLTTAAAGTAVQKFVRSLPRSRRPRVIAIDEIPDSVGATFASVQLDTDDIAYLQYTSGSTRTPVGVEITHRAIATGDRCRPGGGIASAWPAVVGCAAGGGRRHPANHQRQDGASGMPRPVSQWRVGRTGPALIDREPPDRRAAGLLLQRVLMNAGVALAE
jgi:acyl-CoA synthetase (AMP-forming)/AMP-acid ligase II